MQIRHIHGFKNDQTIAFILKPRSGFIIVGNS
jgi:hypothetical protein